MRFKRKQPPWMLATTTTVISLMVFTAAAALLGGCRWRRANQTAPRLSGTQEGKEGESSKTPTPPQPSQGQVSWERVTPGQYPAAEIGTWVEANRKYPGVYFFTYDRSTYILVAWGEKPTSGYVVEVRGVHPATGRGSKDRAQLEVNFRQPAPGTMTAQVITYPYDLIRVPREIRKFDTRFTGDKVPDVPKTLEPNIQVDTPVPGETIRTPLKIKGRARVFEGVVNVYLEDGHNVLYEKSHQGVGAPEWWKMDLSIDFAQPTSPHGMLQLYWASARDGSKQDVVMIPVRFAEVK